MSEALPSSLPLPATNSDESDPMPEEEQQQDENLKRKICEDDKSDDIDIPEKKIKSEKTDEEESKNVEDNENPIIEEDQGNIESDDKSTAKPDTEQKDENGEKSNNETKKKVQNLRKNIKDVIDDSQLDATTLAAQRQESERLARVQEQQRNIRETQRQIACEKQQQKVLSILQVNENEDAVPQEDDSIDPILEKFSLKSTVDIKEAAKATLESIQSIITDAEPTAESDEDDCVMQPVEADKPKTTVVVDSSSDSDDCIILSDEEEEEEDEDDDDTNSGEHTNDSYNTRDAQGRVVINIGHSESEPDIFVAPQIARIIKPHQIGGVRFLYDNIIESTELYDKSSGFGCILAHSMGLGKTLQMVCFCDIFVRHTSSTKILLIMPINTLQNWLNEFNMWLPLPEDVDKSPLTKDGEVRPRTFKIFVLNESYKTLNSRARVVSEWSRDGGVLIMGYEMYRLLSLKKIKQKRKKGVLVDMTTNRDRETFENIYSALVNPGPDLVVCDEGHRIKNSHASTSHALKQIKSKRRVVLTGYPLQNNLLEYWCMVDFVRPSYLGTRSEFCNMFERPIQNGQCIDSTPNDFKLMRYRAHVLHSLLKGFVQRRSHSVLQKSLPEKTEFVMLVRMTKFQRKLYEVFMNEVVRSRKVPNPLKAFAVCCKIWNHPDVLYNFMKKRELDLDLEVDDAETDNVSKKDKKSETSTAVKSTENSIESEIKKPEDKPPMTPSSVDSAYSSMHSSYDSTNQSYYSNFHGYQENQYQNWNGKYYQDSYYSQGNYFSSNSHPNYYSNSSCSSYNSQSDSSLHSSINKDKPGGLLEDVIEKEREEEAKEHSVVKNSRDDGIPYDWAVELMKDYIPDLFENAPKLQLFFCIMDESIKLGDRILVFSQSLLTLNLLEKFLQRSKIPDTDEHWAKNTSYFRLDGCTTALEREKLINEFNNNTRVKLFLVSTRAGSLGINLVGANRVIVFDASWNPCHDTQAVCRVYRYGQTKPCYVYRFVMDNCLEKKIYDRQINKQGMADRIVDECNPDAHLSMKEVTSLCYEDGEDPEEKEFTEFIDKYEDLVTKKVLENYSKALTREPFQHESLLVDRKEKKLSSAEKRLAQRGYEMEKQAASKPSYNYNSNVRMYRTTDGQLIQRPLGSGRPTDFVNNNHSENRNTQQEKPTRWVPVEVWQSKGISAQEMTLPQDVAIQTNSSEKAKIYLRAGQKVIVLKSPKGICLQLQSGKVIAIRASQKPGMPNLNPLKVGEGRPPPRQDGDVIDISNDDEEESGNAGKNKDSSTNSVNITNDTAKITQEPPKADNMYKENKYKPNLLPRKPRPMPSSSNSVPPEIPSVQNDSKFQAPQPRWDNASQQSNYSNSSYQRNGNGNNSNHYRAGSSSESYRNSNNNSTQSSSSAFYTPTSYMPQYPPPAAVPPTSNPMYQGSSSSSYHNSSYPAPPPSGNSGYNYYASYPNHPAPQTPAYSPYQAPQTGFDPNFPNFPGYSSYPPPPSHVYPSHDTAAPPQNPYTNSTNYSQWNYNT